MDGISSSPRYILDQKRWTRRRGIRMRGMHFAVCDCHGIQATVINTKSVRYILFALKNNVSRPIQLGSFDDAIPEHVCDSVTLDLMLVRACALWMLTHSPGFSQLDVQSLEVSELCRPRAKEGAN